MNRTQDNRVVHGQARFSALASGLVRMEYAPDGRFEDRRSVRALARPEAIPFATVESAGNRVRLATERMAIEYNPDTGGGFDAGSLRALDADSGAEFWTPASVDYENLGGVPASMDYVKPGMIPRGVHPASIRPHDNGIKWSWWTFHGRLHSEPADTVGDAATHATLFDEVLATRDEAHLPAALRELVRERASYPPGLLSRAGYFLYNDSGEPVLEAADRPVDREAADGALDLYLFRYGRDYRQALRDYRLLFGATPLIPRYALGLWYSRYPTFNAADVRELVADFARHDLPLDMFVFDLEWHLRGWNGFDWDTDRFPDPDGLLGFLREQAIHTTFNVHPGAVPVDDSRFAAFLEAAGLTCDRDAIGVDYQGGRTFSDFDIADPRQAAAFMDVLHKPVQDQGVDFWWIDGDCPTPGVPALDRQLWTNHVYRDHIQRTYPERRPMIFSREPGLGAHRYPVHFTGDTWSYWETLENQVEQTVRAGHIGQSFITHDIGGHMSSALHIDPELYMRWVQFAVLNPVVRLHSSKQGEGIGGERRPWLYGAQVLTSFQAAMRLRMELLPYLYTLAHESHADGMPMCRSNALQCPDWERGYAEWSTYFLGDRIFATPVVAPGTMRQVRLPPGDWIDGITGQPIQGDGERAHLLIAPFDKRPPHYVRAGSLLVKQPYARRAEPLPDSLVLEIWPAAGTWSDRFSLVEDDGLTQAHADGACTRQSFAVASDGPDRLVLRIGAREGDFAGAPAARRYTVRVIGRTPADDAVTTVEAPASQAHELTVPLMPATG